MYLFSRILTSDQRFTVFENGSLFIAQLNKDDSGVYACRIDNGQNQPAVRRFRLQIEGIIESRMTVHDDVIQE